MSEAVNKIGYGETNSVPTGILPKISPETLAEAKSKRRQEPAGLRYDTFTAADGVKLRYCFWRYGEGAGSENASSDAVSSQKARGTVIFLPGRTEFMEKFIEDMRVMQALGFAVAGLDLRGQGLSQRPFGDVNKHELESFDPHITDVKQLVALLKQKGLPAPYILMAHSAGSHVSLRFMSEYPGLVDRAILSAPMVRIKPASASRGMRLLAAFMKMIGRGSAYVPGHTAFREGPWGWRKQLTHDTDRFEDEDYFTQQKDAGLAVGGATYRWLYAAIKSTDTLNAPGYAEAIKAPVLIFKAGLDQIVDNDATEAFAARLPAAELVTLAAAKHETFKETDGVRAEIYKHIIPFLSDL